MIPQPDAAGVVTAVVSAALFTLAIVLVVRSRKGRSDLEAGLTSVLSANWSGKPGVKPGELFGTVFIERRVPGAGLLGSLVLHVWILLAVPAVPYIFPAKLAFDLRKYDVKIVEFRLPAPLMYSAPSRTQLVRRETSARIQPPDKAGAVRSQASPRQIWRRARFELPMSLRARTKDVVIQPDVAPDVPLPLHHNLPTAFLWAQRPVPLEESRLVGGPENARPPVTFSLPRAVAQVQRPNQEVAVGNLQIADGLVLTFRAPNLLVLRANVTPVRAADSSDARGELPATALPPGRSMNLIALMHSPALPAAGYLIEAGNRLAQAEAGSGNGASGAGQTAQPGDRRDGAPSGAATPTPAKGSYADLLAAATAKPGNASEAPKPAEHPPNQSVPHGNLGVIIVQHSSQESVLEGAEVLTGQPVYTVYFDVPGAPRRWVLQYCIPGAEAEPLIESSETVIHIRPRKSVQPPFPLQRIPFELNGFQGDSRRLVIYALVNARGEVESIKLIRGTGQPIDQTAVATLGRWAFRPATRGEEPVAVEALFGIPLQ